MKAKVNVTLLVPMVPNFLRTPTGDPVSIGQISDKQLRAVGRAWTEAMIIRAKELR